MRTDVDTALKDIADWFIKTRREITPSELQPILQKHCESEQEIEKFMKFLETEPGEMRFKTLLRERKGKQSPEPVTPVTDVELWDRQMQSSLGTFKTVAEAEKYADEHLVSNWRQWIEIRPIATKGTRQSSYLKEPVKIKLTPKEIDVIHFRFLDIGHEWVKLEGSYLVIPPERVKEALDILESACDITRDWPDPTGRAEHRATCNLYEEVKLAAEPIVDNVEVYTSELLPEEVAQGRGLHRDPKVEFRYTTYYYGTDISLFQRDLQRLLREQTGIPYLAVDAYYIPTETGSNPTEPTPQIPVDTFRLGLELAKYTPEFRVEAFEIPARKFSVTLGEIDDKRNIIHLNLWPGATQKDATAVLAHEYAHILPGTTALERGLSETEAWQRGEGYARQWGVFYEYIKLGRELAEYYEAREIHPHIARGIREWLAEKKRK